MKLQTPLRVASATALTLATAHAGTTDSTVSPDGKFLYVESGGAGTIDAYALGTNGSLTPIETIFSIPVGSEGTAISYDLFPADRTGVVHETTVRSR